MNEYLEFFITLLVFGGLAFSAIFIVAMLIVIWWIEDDRKQIPE